MLCFTGLCMNRIALTGFQFFDSHYFTAQTQIFWKFASVTGNWSRIFLLLCLRSTIAVRCQDLGGCQLNLWHYEYVLYVTNRYNSPEILCAPLYWGLEDMSGERTPEEDGRVVARIDFSTSQFMCLFTRVVILHLNYLDLCNYKIWQTMPSSIRWFFIWATLTFVITIPGNNALVAPASDWPQFLRFKFGVG